MGIDRLRAFLTKHRNIALDTSVFIYQLEPDTRYVNLTDEIFLGLEEQRNKAVTSTVTMTELLVHPYRDSDQQRIDEFYAFLSRYPNVTWVAPSLEIADLAAQIRALHRLRTPDSLQAATAIHASATGFITNDSAFTRVHSFETLVLEQAL